MNGINYWEKEADSMQLITHHGEIASRLIAELQKEEPNIGCRFMRFRSYVDIVLNETKYSTEDKKYILKKMYLSLLEFENGEVSEFLRNEFLLKIEPYTEIYRFILRKQDNSNKLTIPQIALLLHYNKVHLPDPRGKYSDKEADDIAGEYGFTAPTSGYQLYEKLRVINKGGGSEITGVKKKEDQKASIETILPFITEPEGKEEALKHIERLRISISDK